MKIQICALLALLSLTCVVHVAAQNPVPVTFTEYDSNERDVRRAGQAFAEVFWDSYNLEVFYTDLAGETSNSMTLTATLQGRITSVSLNGEVIMSEGEGTLPGIPIPKGGMWNVYAYADGVRGDRPMVHGHVQRDLVDETNPLSIVLRPVNKTKIVPYSQSELPAGVNPEDFRLVSENGDWVGYYYSWLNGFVLWVDPTISPISVTVVGPGGRRYESFIVDPFEDPQPVQAASVNFDLVGKVHRFVFDENERYPYAYLFAPMDGVSEINEVVPTGEFKQMVPARSFIYENASGRELDFSTNGRVDSWNSWVRVTVYSVTPGREPFKIAHFSGQSERDSGDADYTVNAGVRIPSGYTNLLFVVEVLSGSPTTDFNFSLGTGGKG